MQFDAIFWENLAKSYVGTPGGLAPPPRGNPGSATVLCEKVACGHPPLNKGSIFPHREGEGVLKYYFMTRMHSSWMRTARSLTVSPSICHACPLPCMPPSHACPPATHAPPAMHAPLPDIPPSHTCPPATHTPLPCTPPPWTEFVTHASENITLPQLRCGR